MLKRNAVPPARKRIALACMTLLLCAALASVACRRIAKPAGWASPVQDQQVLLAASHDTLAAFSGDSLDPLWLFPSPDAEIRPTAALYGTPAIADGAVYLPSYDRKELGSLHKLDIQTGEVLWTFEGNNPFLGSVTVSDGRVYFGDNDGNVYSLDASTGDELWPEPFKTDEQVWAAPAISGNILYVTSLDGHLYAIDAASGEQQWSFGTAAGIAAPAIVDTATNLIFIAGFDSHVRAIDADSGEQRWSVEGANAFWSRPLLLGGTLYAADADGNVYAIDANDGTQRWDKPFQAGDAIRAGAVEADGSLFVVDRSGNLYSIELADGSTHGEPLDLAGTVFADPLARDSDLIVVTADGDVIQVDPQNVSIISQTAIQG